MTAGAPAIGAAVDYHGSLTEHHGPAIVLDCCDCDECDHAWLTRYVLLPGTHTAPTTVHRARVLTHVRPESFTVKETPKP